MSGKAMAQRVRMNTFLDSCSFAGLVTGVPNGFAVDRLIPAMVVIAGEKPDLGFLP
jgi:hypothetical protein